MSIAPQIELKEHEKRVERLNNRITELGKANLSLKRRLRDSNEERDVLALQSVELRASKHSYKGQLEKVSPLFICLCIITRGVRGRPRVYNRLSLFQPSEVRPPRYTGHLVCYTIAS